MVVVQSMNCVFFFSSRRRHTRWTGDWSSDVCSSDLAAQLTDDGLHAHAFHADASSDGIDVFIARHDGDLRALASFASNRADHHRVVINLRHFRLEQVLHELWRRTRNHHLRSLRSSLDPNQHHTHTLANGEGL